MTDCYGCVDPTTTTTTTTTRQATCFFAVWLFSFKIPYVREYLVMSIVGGRRWGGGALTQRESGSGDESSIQASHGGRGVAWA